MQTSHGLKSQPTIRNAPKRSTAICLAGKSIHFPVAAITGTSIPAARTIAQTARSLFNALFGPRRNVAGKRGLIQHDGDGGRRESTVACDVAQSDGLMLGWPRIQCNSRNVDIPSPERLQTFCTFGAFKIAAKRFLPPRNTPFPS